MLKRLVIFFLVTISLQAAESVDLVRTWIQDYNVLLKENVALGKKEGIETTLVNYQNLRATSNFRKLIYDLAKLPPFETLSNDDQLAMWINAYNVLAMKLIVENPDIASIKQLDSIFNSVWKRKVGIVAGRSYSLDEIEHDIVRTRFREPRIHFAINCASISCPNLANYAYEGKYLDEQLSHQAKVFLKNPTKGLAVKSGALHLSKLFKWFEEDFRPDVREWLVKNGYLNQSDKDLKIKYMSYNWALNSQKNK